MPIMRVIDGRTIAAARALANVSVKELAAEAGVTERTVGRLEVDTTILISPRRRHGHVAKDTFDKIVSALRQRGVELLSEDEDQGAGVRWVRPRAKRGTM
jgi:transcriptional regulator with XRE-family HTH domain